MLWKDKYKLGVPEIDAQHRELFDRVEAFIQDLRADVVWEEKVCRVNETMAFMRDYVVVHFRDEEACQLRVGFPGYEAHKQSHQGMADYVAEISEQCAKNSCDEQLAQQFAGRLMAWLINHVAAEDQQIADYITKLESEQP